MSCGLGRSTLLTLAVALHNLPEGMAVGVVYAGWLTGEGNITMAGALALSLGIAIQNFPEGAIISMPLRAEGNSRASPSSMASSPAWWSPSGRFSPFFWLASWYRRCPML